MSPDHVNTHEYLDNQANTSGRKINNGDKGWLEFKVAKSSYLKDVQDVFYKRGKLPHQQQQKLQR